MSNILAAEATLVNHLSGYSGWTIVPRISGGVIAPAAKGRQRAIVTLAAPSAGPTSFTAAYIGVAGAGPAFAASGATQLLFNGQAGGTIPAGGTLVGEAIFTIPDGVDINIAVQIATPGANPIKNGPNNIGWSTYYKAGSEAAIVGKSGYSGPSSHAYMVARIEASDDDADHHPVGEIENGASGIARAMAGQCFAASTRVRIPGTPGQYMHLMLDNGSSTGVDAAITDISLNIQGSGRCLVAVTALSSIPSGTSPIFLPSSCNVFFSPNSSPSKAKLYWFNRSEPIGALHSLYELTAGKAERIVVKDAPVAVVAPGEKALLTFLDSGFGVVGSMFWEEIPR